LAGSAEDVFIENLVLASVENPVTGLHEPSPTCLVMPMTCEHCRWWAPLDDDDSKPKFGKCGHDRHSHLVPEAGFGCLHWEKRK
jgi:hypothetical protein